MGVHGENVRHRACLAGRAAAGKGWTRRLRKLDGPGTGADDSRCYQSGSALRRSTRSRNINDWVEIGFGVLLIAAVLTVAAGLLRVALYQPGYYIILALVIVGSVAVGIAVKNNHRL